VTVLLTPIGDTEYYPRRMSRVVTNKEPTDSRREIMFEPGVRHVTYSLSSEPYIGEM